MGKQANGLKATNERGRRGLAWEVLGGWRAWEVDRGFDGVFGCFTTIGNCFGSLANAGRRVAASTKRLVAVKGRLTGHSQRHVGQPARVAGIIKANS